MKTKQLILLFAFALLFMQGAAQDVPQEPRPLKIGTAAPYFVLKVGEKSVGIDTKEEISFDLKSINSEGIQEICVLKDKTAISQYGDKGTNGVVIITFKESYVLPETLKAKFDAIK